MYIISDEESDRIRIVKCMAIILVVYIHSYATKVNFSDGTNTFYLPVWLQVIEYGLSQVVARCGVPVFFLISAILLFRSNSSYLSTVSKRARSLLVPYLIWNTFWIAIFAVLQSLPFTTMYFSGANTPILKCTLTEWLKLYGIGTGYPQCYPLWFMRDLMVVLLFYPAVRAFVNICPKIMLCVGVALALMPFDCLGKMALTWFIIGAAAVKMQIHLTFLDDIPMRRIMSIYIAFAIISLFFDMNVIRGSFIFIGIAFLFRLSKEIYVREKLKKKFMWLSQWTFLIYVLHELTLSSVKKMCLRILPQTPVFLLLEYLLIPVFVITGCIIAGVLFKRIAPRIYRFSTQSR